MLYLLIGIGIYALLYFSKFFRDIVRWILMIPLAVVALVVYYLFGIPEAILMFLLSKFIPYFDIIGNAISLGMELIIIYGVTGSVAPCRKIGVCISIVLSFLVLLSNLLAFKIFVFIPIGVMSGGR